MSAEIPSGAMRFNSDSQKLEYWNGSAWFQVHTATPNLGDAGDREPGPRGVTGGANNASINNVLNYVTISSTGDAVDFGDCGFTATERREGCASSTRGIIAGGYRSPAPTTAYNNIEFITIASTGNAQDFGDLTNNSKAGATLSNSTRGIHFIGNSYPSITNIINYVTISSTGNANDFGDTSANFQESTATANTTRGLYFQGIEDGQPAGVNTIEYVTIATLGNTQDFGDVSNTNNGSTAGTSFANSTRAILGGMYLEYTRIESIQINSFGTGVFFGDLNDSKFFRASMNSPTRGIFAGGRNNTNAMQYINISTQGNAVDFGDLTQDLAYHAGFSNAHGGL